MILYIGWINNKVLLYSTGNYIQYPVTNHSGKEYEKEYKKIKRLSLIAKTKKQKQIPVHKSTSQVSIFLKLFIGFQYAER